MFGECMFKILWSTVNKIYSRRPTCHIYVADDDIVKADEDISIICWTAPEQSTYVTIFFWLIKLSKTSKQEWGVSEPSETLDIGIVSVKSRIFWIQYQVSVSVPFNVQNRDWSRYRSRSMLRTGTGLGIGPVQILGLARLCRGSCSQSFPPFI